ncbi:MAG: pilus assembly protein [Tessaracoccus sp.]|uniref:TadE/TadG family type IV pilus assembly protein n=1 Tax=Tessaracoccus sp. TaxID=1971211 RepID=UPI001EB8DCCA|nr:TadE/TadG family type IV pilus assembly protein [Tessaracoccus sp.]MBK7820267.1 pilus assembly protein [Tessaracoccus sp.]
MSRERGAAASVEAVIILPALVLFIGLLLSLARLTLADQHVNAAAATAARAAALERTVPAAERAADEALSVALAEHGLSCRTVSTAVDAGGVARALGRSAMVSVRVTCAVELADITLPGIPGTVSVTATKDAPVDPLRGR